MFTRIHTAHVYFSQTVKLSALLCIFRTNCNSNDGALLQVELPTEGTSTFAPAMVFYGQNRNGKFSSKRTLICRGKSDCFTQCQPSNGENYTASDVYDYLNENKHD